MKLHKKFLISAFTIKILIVFFLYYPFTVYAETHIYSNDLNPNWIWNEENSPYILEESIYIPKDYILNINKGVTVKSANIDGDAYSITLDGDLEIQGTQDKPVIFDNLYSIHLSNNNSDINYAVFEKTGLDFMNSTTTITNTKITGAFEAISSTASRVNIEDSEIKDNTYGISSYNFNPIFQAIDNNHKIIPNTGGIGNAVDIINPKQNIITIHNSSMVNNSGLAILNQTNNTIDAIDNWWGSSYGPSALSTMGLVNTNPWIDIDPSLLNKSDECCSSVVFIPGIEASRLYKDENGLFGTSTNKLWEPILYNDIKKLYTDNNGKSLDSSIYTKDIIDNIPGIKNIYKSFINTMDDMVQNKIINAWKPLAYDWRSSAFEISTESVIKNIEDMAKNSKTHKVIIIAHSNGGLVTKDLMMKLEQKGESGLVEKVIMIAVPELGTPEAMFSLLHGYDQDIAYGLILSKNDARNFSLNLSGAYGLLPSRKFYENTGLETIYDYFSKNTKIISTYNDMKDFILNGTFSKFSTTDTNTPILLNNSLMSINEDFHNRIDNWKSSSTTDVLSIFGWGIPTSEAIQYFKDNHCIKTVNNIDNCGISFKSKLSSAGDGTVLTKSNSNNNSTLYFDLDKLHKDIHKSINHANILESSDLLEKIQNTITKKDDSNASYQKYFSTSEPIDNRKYLTISVHSPVDINVYDKNGGHTGLIYNSYHNRYLTDEDNNINGAYYGEYGNLKLVTLPYGEDYQIVLSGNDSGDFYVDAEVSLAGNIIASTTFPILPVTPLMNINFVVSTSTEQFATNTVMEIDVDGDNTTDLISHSQEYIHTSSTSIIKDPLTYIEVLKKIMSSMDLPSLTKNTLIKRLDKLEHVYIKGNEKKAEKYIKKLSNKIFKQKKLNDIQKKSIIDLINKLVNNLENN